MYKELGIHRDVGNEAFKKNGEAPLLTAIAEFGSSRESAHAQADGRPGGNQGCRPRALRTIRMAMARKTFFSRSAFWPRSSATMRLASPRRNVMIVVFTDEAGDDIAALDAAVEVCRKYEMPVYVIGVPAPFGREVAFVKYVDPDPKYDQSPQRRRCIKGRSRCCRSG